MHLLDAHGQHDVIEPQRDAQIGVAKRQPTRSTCTLDFGGRDAGQAQTPRNDRRQRALGGQPFADKVAQKNCLD